MNRPCCHVLILDTDPDILLALQQVLEDALIDTTITWDENEARQLLKQRSFDLLLVGDHPHFKTASILRDISFEHGAHACVMLQDAARTDIESLRGIGVVAAIPKRDLVKVLELVELHCPGKAFRVTAATVDNRQARHQRVAS